MASAKQGVHIVQLRPIFVPETLRNGEKFIKWDEDSGTGNPVTLRVDPNGFYLYWTNQNKETDCLDISTVRDTRTGKGARLPKDAKLRQVVTMGSQDSLEDKTLTVVSGPDFVNLSYLNFCCAKKETAKLWADELVAMAYNLLQLNGPIMLFLKKLHSKLSIMADKQGKIPVKNIVRAFAQNKEDRKRVEKALEASAIATGKSDTISPSKFTFEEFFAFYKNLTVRPEVEKVFDDFSSFNKKKLMSAEQFMEFINKEQRDPRLNEILYPYTTPERATELITAYEPNACNAQKGLLSLDGFLRYLLSDDNAIVSMEKFDLSDDMDHPLNHYFINSSHNTYLTGHQLTGKSSVEMYRQSLLAGCRCVELDFWNGKSEEPSIVHGYTLVPDIPAKDVIEAIAESAFKTSEYPVILSFENHCNPKQQAKIAQYCREFFGPMLLDGPLDSHPLAPGVPLPPPSSLKRRIIIKNKKKHHHHKQKPQKKMSKAIIPENGESPPLLAKDDSTDSVENDDTNSTLADDDDSLSSDEDDDSASSTTRDYNPITDDKGTAGKESEAGAEISALVNYVQPVHFYTFENAMSRNKSYEMSSFDEKQAMTLLKERPVEFVNYNKHQLSRVYPKGTRVDSANFMPQLFWNAGCQLVALNYQTLDVAMQLNLGIFELNNQCGYLLKPEFMRIKHRRFDPFAESTVDGIIAGTVAIKVISGQFLSDKRVGTYVEVEMYGLPTDTVRKKFKTKMVPANGLNPLYDEEPFVFKKVVLPDLAVIRIVCYEESGKMIGHRVLPVVGLRPGYRHVVLRNESGQPINMAAIFLLVTVKDYVPDGFADFAEALANPIKHHNERDKRAQQLSVLQDDNQDESSANEDSEPLTNKLLLRNPSYLRKFHETANNSPPLSGAGPLFSGRSDSFDDIKKPSSTSASQPSPVVPESTGSSSTSVGAASRAPSRTPSTGTTYMDAAKSVIEAEQLDKFWEQKIIREKKAELEKKIDALRKKHEKDRKVPKVGAFKKSHHELVKKLSSKNLKVTMLKKDSPALSLQQEQLIKEKDMLEQGHEEVYNLMEKTIKAAQTRQLSLLKGMEKKENADIMNEIGNMRKDEFRRLSKLTRDKNELDRMKRETTTRLVEVGVQGREKTAKSYSKHRAELEANHLDVLRQLAEEKEQMLRKIEQDYQERLKNLSVQDDDDLRTHAGIQHST